MLHSTDKLKIIVMLLTAASQQSKRVSAIVKDPQHGMHNTVRSFGKTDHEATLYENRATLNCLDLQNIDDNNL